MDSYPRLPSGLEQRSPAEGPAPWAGAMFWDFSELLGVPLSLDAPGKG